jgi:hypothetical protein
VQVFTSSKPPLSNKLVCAFTLLSCTEQTKASKTVLFRAKDAGIFFFQTAAVKIELIAGKIWLKWLKKRKAITPLSLQTI